MRQRCGVPGKDDYACLAAFDEKQSSLTPAPFGID